MLYHRHSFNYYARIMTAMRLRVLLAILRRAGHWRADREQIRARPLGGVRGNADRRVWEIHYQNFLKEGWGYLKAENFVHHCTAARSVPLPSAAPRRENCSAASATCKPKWLIFP